MQIASNHIDAAEQAGDNEEWLCWYNKRVELYDRAAQLWVEGEELLIKLKGWELLEGGLCFNHRLP